MFAHASAAHSEKAAKQPRSLNDSLISESTAEFAIHAETVERFIARTLRLVNHTEPDRQVVRIIYQDAPTRKRGRKNANQSNIFSVRALQVEDTTLGLDHPQRFQFFSAQQKMARLGLSAEVFSGGQTELPLLFTYEVREDSANKIVFITFAVQNLTTDTQQNNPNAIITSLLDHTTLACAREMTASETDPEEIVIHDDQLSCNIFRPVMTRLDATLKEKAFIGQRRLLLALLQSQIECWQQTADELIECVSELNASQHASFTPNEQELLRKVNLLFKAIDGIHKESIVEEKRLAQKLLWKSRIEALERIYLSIASLVVASVALKAFDATPPQPGPVDIILNDPETNYDFQLSAQIGNGTVTFFLASTATTLIAVFYALVKNIYQEYQKASSSQRKIRISHLLSDIEEVIASAMQSAEQFLSRLNHCFKLIFNRLYFSPDITSVYSAKFSILYQKLGNFQNTIEQTSEMHQFVAKLPMTRTWLPGVIDKTALAVKFVLADVTRANSTEHYEYPAKTYPDYLQHHQVKSFWGKISPYLLMGYYLAIIPLLILDLTKVKPVHLSETILENVTPFNEECLKQSLKGSDIIPHLLLVAIYSSCLLFLWEVTNFTVKHYINPFRFFSQGFSGWRGMSKTEESHSLTKRLVGGSS